MDEKRKEELKIKENKLMMRQAGFIALMIIVFIPYFKFCAYLSNLFWFSYFMFNLTMLLGIPLSYFAAKYIVRVIKKIIWISFNEITIFYQSGPSSESVTLSVNDLGFKLFFSTNS